MIKKFFKEKHPVIGYLIISFLITLLISSVTVGVIYLILSMTGIYGKLEMILDLQYRSPLIIVPIFVFAGIAIVAWIVGILLYFHKYKRYKFKSEFGDELKGILK